MIDLTNVEEIECRAVVAWRHVFSDDKEKFESFKALKEAEEYRARLGEDAYSRIFWSIFIRWADGFESWLLDCDSRGVAEIVAAGLRLLLKRKQCCGDAACYNESSGVPCAAEKSESRKKGT